MYDCRVHLARPEANLSLGTIAAYGLETSAEFGASDLLEPNDEQQMGFTVEMVGLYNQPGLQEQAE